MLRFVNYNIVFQEIPGEVTLAINISNCPNHCKDCHSQYLWNNIGEELNTDSLSALLKKYGNAITCICFMGGDSAPLEVEKLAIFSRKQAKNQLKTGWYSGKDKIPQSISIQNFDYIKLGPYLKHLGGLDSEKTNQRFYQIKNGEMADLSSLFYKKSSYL